MGNFRDMVTGDFGFDSETVKGRKGQRKRGIYREKFNWAVKTEKIHFGSGFIGAFHRTDSGISSENPLHVENTKKIIWVFK